MNKKKGGKLKWVVIVIVALLVIGAAAGGGGDDKQETSSVKSEEADQKDAKNDAKEENEQEEPEEPIEYLEVTAADILDELSNNAIKASDTYKEKYLEITGVLGNMDSDGKYISIGSGEDFEITDIQCYIKSDEQKQAVMGMSKGDTVTVKGYCKDIGEVIGYQVDINEITSN